MNDASQPLLQVEDLITAFDTEIGQVRAVDGVSLTVERGRTLGIWNKDEITREDMIRSMSGADELEALSHELDELARRDAAKEAVLSDAEHEIADSLEEGE